jgi:hypothetical protein
MNKKETTKWGKTGSKKKKKKKSREIGLTGVEHEKVSQKRATVSVTAHTHTRQKQERRKTPRGTNRSNLIPAVEEKKRSQSGAAVPGTCCRRTATMRHQLPLSSFCSFAIHRKMQQTGMSSTGLTHQNDRPRDRSVVNHLRHGRQKYTWLVHIGRRSDQSERLAIQYLASPHHSLQKSVEQSTCQPRESQTGSTGRLTDMNTDE